MQNSAGDDITIEQLIVDIIQREMGLDTQDVWIRDSNHTIPNDKGLYVVVGLSPGGSQTISQSTYLNDESEQVQEAVISERIEVDILSASHQSIRRRWEVMAALNSYLSKQVQEKYNFRIYRNPVSFSNLSGAEGGSNIIRYQTDFVCHVWYRKTQVIPQFDYFDDFNTRVDDEKTIGTTKPIIQFEIE